MSRAIRMREMWGLPLTKREREYVDRLIGECGGLNRFRVKQCYRNAQKLIFADKEKRLRYCEGYYWATLDPHAWLTVNGKVVDPTAEAVDRYMKRHYGSAIERARKYFGCTIDRRTASLNCVRTGEWRAILPLDQIRNEFILRQLKYDRHELTMTALNGFLMQRKV